MALLMAPLYKPFPSVESCAETSGTTPAPSAAASSQEAAELSRVPAGGVPRVLKHKRRYCRAPGCTRIVKSQGLCQRHGAKPRKCRVEGCTKQAQGNYDGMCKSHFKANKRAASAPVVVAPPPAASHSSAVESSEEESNNYPPMVGESVYDRVIPSSLTWKPGNGTLMPLIHHLRAGFECGKPPAWHRNEERRARGLWPVENAAAQLEGWERELVWTEILLLTGNPDSSFRHLARAWGRDKGFHMVLAQFICERHGDVERKKRDPATLRKLAEAADGGMPGDGIVGSGTWDDTCYFADGEPVGPDLMAFPAEHRRNVHEQPHHHQQQLVYVNPEPMPMNHHAYAMQQYQPYPVVYTVDRESRQRYGPMNDESATTTSDDSVTSSYDSRGGHGVQWMPPSGGGYDTRGSDSKQAAI